MSTCDDPLKNGSCSGTAGCCQAELPPGVQFYQGFFNSLHNTTKIWKQTPCNYITVMESAAFSFSSTYLNSTVLYDSDDGRTPVVMEWGITRQTCEEAKANKTAYACVSNHSDCVYSDAAGYRCRCSGGFKGNPYVVDGCAGSFLLRAQTSISMHAQVTNRCDFFVRFSDIDECLDSATYPCAGICKNTLGNFTCSCPRGRSMINGVCVKSQRSTWMVPVVGRSLHKLRTCVRKIPCREHLFFFPTLFQCFPGVYRRSNK